MTDARTSSSILIDDGEFAQSIGHTTFPIEEMLSPVRQALDALFPRRIRAISRGPYERRVKIEEPRTK